MNANISSGYYVVEIIRLLNTTDPHDTVIEPTQQQAWLFSYNQEQQPIANEFSSTIQQHDFATGNMYSLATGGTAVSVCPNNCTNQYQGTCNSATGVCTCAQGFFGADCSQIQFCTSNADCSGGTYVFEA